MHPPPELISEYAATCIRYVRTAVGISLDFEAETLPLLDHYLRQSRAGASNRPETLPLLAAVAGAYLGELIRRRHACHWHLVGEDPGAWCLDFEEVPLQILPVSIAVQALDPESDPGPFLILDDERRAAVELRLAELPDAEPEDYVAPSTRVEVIDIAVDALRVFAARSRVEALQHQGAHDEGDDAPSACDDAVAAAKPDTSLS